MTDYIFTIYKCAKGETKGRPVSYANTEENAKLSVNRFRRLHPHLDFVVRKEVKKQLPNNKQAWIGPPRAA